jgi:hypothetical protein
MPCGPGLPPVRPDGAVIKGSNAGDLGDTEGDNNIDVEEDDESRIGGFQDQACLSLLVSSVGALWASGAHGFR